MIWSKFIEIKYTINFIIYIKYKFFFINIYVTCVCYQNLNITEQRINL